MPRVPADAGKGVALLPVMVALMQWGDEHVYDGDAAVLLRERITGERVRLELRTSAGPVSPSDIVPTPLLTVA